MRARPAAEELCALAVPRGAAGAAAGLRGKRGMLAAAAAVASAAAGGSGQVTGLLIEEARLERREGRGAGQHRVVGERALRTRRRQRRQRRRRGRLGAETVEGATATNTWRVAGLARQRGSLCVSTPSPRALLL